MMYAGAPQKKQIWEPRGSWVSVSHPASKLFSHLFSGLEPQPRSTEAAVICLAQESRVLSVHSKLPVTRKSLLTLKRPADTPEHAIS